MRIVVGAVVVLALLGTACASEPPSPEAQARRIESQVWSPYCPGRLLADCTTSQSQELRVEIERRLRSGDGTQEVYRWLRANYGDEILARPDAEGTQLAIWLVPIAAIAVGGVLVIGLVRRWSAPAPIPPDELGGEDITPAEREALLQRIRDEVRRDR